MHDKKRNCGNKHSLKLVSLAHSYAFLKVEPFTHTEAGRNFLKNLTQHINTHIMYDIDHYSHNWDVKPYLTPEERILRGYILAPIPAPIPPITDFVALPLDQTTGDNVVDSSMTDQRSATDQSNNNSEFTYKNALLTKTSPVLTNIANSTEKKSDYSSVEYLQKISVKDLSDICANIGRPQPKKQKAAKVADAYNSVDLTKEYDDLQRDIDALVALPQPDAYNLLADEFWNNLIEKKQMEHNECPRLFSIWSMEPMDCFTDLRSLPLLYSSF